MRGIRNGEMAILITLNHTDLKGEFRDFFPPHVFYYHPFPFNILAQNHTKFPVFSNYSIKRNKLAV
jgi:hypothetical protein